MAYSGGRKTRRNRGGKVLNVRSHAAVKDFEKILSKGPLTLVYVNAKWCGACHRFNDEVWSPLTKLKNKSVNLASVDSESIGNTSLASVPRKFYPTLMLVGPDKKPATFKDEDGQPTNAMPRNSTLSEDREALSNLVQNPTMKNTPRSNNTPRANSMARANSMPRANNMPRANSMPRANVTIKSLAKSPFEPKSISNKNLSANQSKMGNTQSSILSSNPPDVGADLVASQKREPGKQGQEKVNLMGGMLEAIKNKTASMKAMLKMRSNSTRKNIQ